MAPDMRITRNRLDMLYRYALAGFFTSPSTPANYDRHAAIMWLVDRQLLTATTPRRITDDGKDLLDQHLDRDRLHQLNRLRERRAASKAT